MSPEMADITPTPRILRTLGDIPFETWQCLAEFADNSLDAFSEAHIEGITIHNPRIDIHWSREDVAASMREIVVQDNGPGMTIETLTGAAKAGYSSNDPIHNLGLFGMGFNIATARLGDETEFLSTTPDSESWEGIRINFDELEGGKVFSAPIIKREKGLDDVSGTMIVVKKLKGGILEELKKKETTIRRRLENIYTAILAKKQIHINVQGKQLNYIPHCRWGESRYVTRRGTRIDAVQRIDKDIGDTYFDITRNRYLSGDEIAEIEAIADNGSELPDHVTRRTRRLRGWLGIQRYCDTSDFGIDFIRNGRKILIRDKTLFGYENPATGTKVLEYPLELGSTVGGRIIGEIHVDYLIPTYQKNGFDTSGLAWQLTVDLLRGDGPILQKQRKALGYNGDNESPLGKLIRGYRRVDPGTKCLALPNSIAKEFYAEYRMGQADYESDEKWFRAAQEADRARGERDGTTPVDDGEDQSDKPEDYDPPPGGGGVPGVIDPDAEVAPVTSARGELIDISQKSDILCGRYKYGLTPPFLVTSWKVNEGHIKLNGRRVPCHLFQDGVEMDFIYDLTHPILAEFPITPKQLMLQLLAEKFSRRDAGVSIQEAYIGLLENHLKEERLNFASLQERAAVITSSIRDSLPTLLGHQYARSIAVVREVEADEEEMAKRMLDEAPQLLEHYRLGNENAIQSLNYVPDKALLRLVKEFPEELLDGKLFNLPYLNLTIGTEAAQGRLKAAAIDKIVNYLRDIIGLSRSGVKHSKNELQRHANTLTLLEGYLE